MRLIKLSHWSVDMGFFDGATLDFFRANLNELIIKHIELLW